MRGPGVRFRIAAVCLALALAGPAAGGCSMQGGLDCEDPCWPGPRLGPTNRCLCEDPPPPDPCNSPPVSWLSR